jgi:hypothetical protein
VALQRSRHTYRAAHQRELATQGWSEL